MLTTVMTKVNPEMIVLARESRGLSQRDLADRLGISPALLCQLEQSNRSLSDDMIEKLERELKYPQGFFGQEGEAYLTSTINFRKRLKVPRNLISSIESEEFSSIIFKFTFLFPLVIPKCKPCQGLINLLTSMGLKSNASIFNL